MNEPQRREEEAAAAATTAVVAVGGAGGEVAKGGHSFSLPARAACSAGT